MIAPQKSTSILLLLTVLTPFAVANSLYSGSLYSNDFIDPNYILAHNFSESTLAAQQSIVSWAGLLAAKGPWSVINKPVAPASGDFHDYLSWAPYWWPDCSNVQNITALTQEEVWTECTYVNRDGQFNPDRTLVQNNNDFTSMSNAAIYGALAWQLTSNQTYAENVSKFISAWFLDEDTMMNPNMNYGQVIRGPNSSLGAHTGLLDVKAMTRVSSAILILRGGNSSSWTSELDTKMNNWASTYLEWIANSPLGIAEMAALNNHGTFCVNQVAAMQILVGDFTAAKQTLDAFFNGAYLQQIAADGEQPLEADRTHPYHYRAYNLQALVVNARMGSYLGVDYWNHPTSNGSYIQTALDYASQFTVEDSGDGPIEELFTSMAAVASAYGDPDDKYSTYIGDLDSTFPSSPYFFWNQPLSDLNLAAAIPTSTISQTRSTMTASVADSSSSKSSGSNHMKVSILGLLSGAVWSLSVQFL